MSTEKDIEKRIKESFENQDFEIQDTWLQDMSDKLDDFNKEPKRKFGFWIFLLGGLLLSSAAGAYWYAKNNVITNSEQTKISVQKNVSKLNAIKETASTNFLTEKNCDDDIINTNLTADIFESEKSAREENANQNYLKLNNTTKNNSGVKEIKNQKKLSQKTENLTNQRSENSVVSNNTAAITKPKTQNTTLKSVNNDILLTSTQANNSSFIANKESNLKPKKEVHLNNNTSNADFQDNKTNKKESSETKVTTNALKAETTLKRSNTEIKPKLDKISASENKNEAIDSLKEAVLENTLTEEKNKDSLDLKTKKKEDKLKKGKKDLGLSLAINAGPSILFRSFSSSTQNEKRTTEETNKIGWNTNIELYKTFKNKIVLATGVQANNYGEKIEYTKVTMTLMDTVYNIVPKDYLNLNIVRTGSAGQYFYNYDTTAIVYNDSSIIIRDSIYENSSVTKSNANSQFTYLEIPVLFGYKILDTKKFDIITTTGVSVGFLLHSKGFYISPKNELEEATNTKINFNYLLNAQLNYQLYKNLNLSLAPNFKYNINNQSRLVGTKKRYASFGINGGIILDF